jgi:hypothetical protein
MAKKRNNGGGGEFTPAAKAMCMIVIILTAVAAIFSTLYRANVVAPSWAIIERIAWILSTIVIAVYAWFWARTRGTFWRTIYFVAVIIIIVAWVLGFINWQ